MTRPGACGHSARDQALDPQNPRYREHLLRESQSWRTDNSKDVLSAVQDAKALHAEGYDAGMSSARTSYLALGIVPELAAQTCESPATPLDEGRPTFLPGARLSCARQDNGPGRCRAGPRSRR